MRIDDAYGWALAGEAFRVIVDPCLVDDETAGAHSLRTAPERAALAVDALVAPVIVLLTSAAEPHCHLVTLAELPADVRVVGPAEAVRRARRVGVRSTIELTPGVPVCLDGRLRITAETTRGRSGQRASAYRIVSLDSGLSVYLDTHRPRRMESSRRARADALIVAADAMRVLGRLRTPDALEAVELARAMDARWLIPMAPPGELATATLAERLAHSQAEPRLLRALVRLHLPEGRVAWLRPGQGVDLAASSLGTMKALSRRRPCAHSAGEY